MNRLDVRAGLSARRAVLIQIDVETWDLPGSRSGPRPERPANRLVVLVGTLGACGGSVAMGPSRLSQGFGQFGLTSALAGI